MGDRGPASQTPTGMRCGRCTRVKAVGGAGRGSKGGVNQLEGRQQVMWCPVAVCKQPIGATTSYRSAHAARLCDVRDWEARGGKRGCLA